eukprot:6217815-Pyramimonas_sp.AAC.1
MNGRMCTGSSMAYDPLPTRCAFRSIHAHFLEQRRKPEKLNMVCPFYDMSSDKPGTGMRTYEWLIAHIEMLMLREKE